MALLEDKVFAITGGASGIGLALAKLLVSRGARVSVADVNEKALKLAVADIEKAGSGPLKPTVLARQVDVCSTNAVNAWVRDTVDTFGYLSGAANFAGASPGMGSTGIINQSEEDWEVTMGVNVTGMMHCMRAELRVMSPGGSIVNAASAAGLQGVANAGPLSASKHAIIGLTRSVAKEVGKDGTRINCVAPGPINTPLFHATKDLDLEAIKNGTVLKRLGEPEEVASLVAFLLGDESRYITGTVSTIDGGLGC